MSAFTDNKFSMNAIESLQDFKLRGKLYKKSLRSSFRYWRFRYFKLFSSHEYLKYDQNFAQKSGFKILIYYEDDKYIIGNNKKGIVIIFENELIVSKSSDGKSCILKNIFKLKENGELYSQPCELHLKTDSSASEMFQWIDALFEKEISTIISSNIDSSNQILQELAEEKDIVSTIPDVSNNIESPSQASTVK